MGRCLLLGGFGLACCVFLACSGRASSAQSEEKENLATAAEARALAFLAREVPRWSAENKCYSCHNNGDAARALYAALRLGYRVPPSALTDTSAWLTRPEDWDRNRGDAAFSDKRLARIQFAAALAAAVEVGQSKDRQPLLRAARLVAADQASDGSWPLEDAGSLGSPATYGRPLATYMAREILRSADAAQFHGAIENANLWLGRMNAKNVLDASVVLLADDSNDQPDSIARRRHALDLLHRSQSGEGGWGPYTNSPPEPFDTAIVLLALRRFEDHPNVSSMVERGRAFLVATQFPDGSWPETTRPAGAESYAQRLSTAGWATLALLATRAPPKPR